jgi:hypothetical protein
MAQLVNGARCFFVIPEHRNWNFSGTHQGSPKGWRERNGNIHGNAIRARSVLDVERFVKIIRIIKYLPLRTWLELAPNVNAMAQNLACFASVPILQPITRSDGFATFRGNNP